MMFDRVVRTIHKDTVIIYKRFDKYIIYYKDIKLISYICKYKYLFNRLYIDSNYINYVIKYLNNYNINYLVIDIINSNDVIYDKKFDNNNYHKYYLKSKRYYKNKKKIININVKLRNMDIDNIERINNYLGSIC